MRYRGVDISARPELNMKRRSTWIQSARREITIVNEQGLHARPAAEFVCAAKAFRSHIWLIKGGERFSAASILDVLIANLNYGETAVIEAEGPDAEEALERLVELVSDLGKRDL